MGLFWKAVEMAAVLLLALTVASSGQQQPAECASKLLPCRDYLNSTSPPDICCDPMREAVRSDLPCLCTLFNSTQILKAFGVNLTQAFLLPQRCRIKQGLDSCNSTASHPTAGSTSGTTADGKNSAGSVYSTGNLSSLMALLVLGAFFLVQL